MVVIFLGGLSKADKTTNPYSISLSCKRIGDENVVARDKEEDASHESTINRTVNSSPIQLRDPAHAWFPRRESPWSSPRASGRPNVW